MRELFDLTLKLSVFYAQNFSTCCLPWSNVDSTRTMIYFTAIYHSNNNNLTLSETVNHSMFFFMLRFKFHHSHTETKFLYFSFSSPFLFIYLFSVFLLFFLLGNTDRLSAAFKLTSKCKFIQT